VRAERPGPTVPLEEAHALLLGELRRLAPREVPLDDCLGCCLAEGVIADEDVPPFANAAMDGFAVRSSDTTDAPARLKVMGDVRAGDAPSLAVGPGQAMMIATGAAVPPGADAVCMVEHTTPAGAEVVLERPVTIGQNVRYAGEDIARGDEVFAAHTVVGPSHIGVLANLGVSSARVFPKARVGVLATGNELQADPGPLEPGRIRESNRHSLLAAVRRTGCESIDLGVARDDAAVIAEALARGAQGADVILTSGGVSVGVADHMKSVLDELSGGRSHWMELAVRPAKPFGFAVLDPSRVPVLCLPGNPVSAMVSFEILARPALLFMMGRREVDRPVLRATAGERLGRKADGKVHFMRVSAHTDAQGRLLVHGAGAQGSHQLHAMARANALAVLPDGTGVDAGDPVRVLLLDPDDLGAVAAQ
jgi:molybdenum cofactor synthesis domain-containing protein